MSLALVVAALQAVDPYVQLGTAIPSEPWDAVQQYVGQGLRGGPGEGEAAVRPPSFVIAGASPLAAQRAAVHQWASILAGLRQVSEATYNPGAGREGEGYAAIKNLVKFAAWGAHVRFAEGDRHGAVTVLLDGLTLARRLRRGNTLDALVGSACEAIVMGSFEEHLAQIPLPECERVRKVAEGYLAERMPVPSDASATLRALMGDDPARWTMQGVDQVLSAFAKTLTQMRLLRLHMWVEAYRWQNLSLPKRLIDAAPSEETDDPLTQEPYRYELTGASYRITSGGFKGLGPMGLRYRPDPNRPGAESPATAKP